MQTQDRQLFLVSLLDFQEDSLAPLRFITRKFDTKSDDILVKVSNVQRLNDTITFIIPIIAILITILQLMYG